MLGGELDLSLPNFYRFEEAVAKAVAGIGKGKTFFPGGKQFTVDGFKIHSVKVIKKSFRY